MSGHRYRMSRDLGLSPTTGLLVPSGKLYFWVSGASSVAQDTYSDAGQTSANANPVVANSAGFFDSDIFGQFLPYRVEFKDSSGNLLWTEDPWLPSRVRFYAAALPSSNWEGLETVLTATHHLNERDFADGAWVDRGDVDSIGNAATVTQALEGTSTAVVMTPDATAALWQRGTNITPGGGTVSLPSTGGTIFNVAAGNFSAISSAQGGRKITVVYGGASVITCNTTSLILQGVANAATRTTVAGDVSEFTNEAAADASGGNWRETNWSPTGITQGPVPDFAATQAQTETPASNILWVTPARMQYHPGVCKGWVNFTIAAATTASHNVTSITDTSAAKWAIVWATDFSSASYCCVTGSEAVANNETAVDTLSAGGVNVKMYRSDDTNTAETNSTASHVAAFGDQA